MVNNRAAFVSAWLGTAVLLFAAGSADYGRPRLETAVEALTWAAAAGTVATTVFAFRSFWKARSVDSALIVLGLACSPFVVGGLLALNGTEPNDHFTSAIGLVFYGLLHRNNGADTTLVAGIRALRRAGESARLATQTPKYGILGKSPDALPLAGEVTGNQTSQAQARETRRFSISTRSYDAAVDETRELNPRLS